MKVLLNKLAVVFAVASILLLVPPNASAKKGGDNVPPGQAKKAEAATHESQGHEDHHGDEAHEHKGHEHDAAVTTTGTPPGWSHGKKTGWHGMPYPPGWAKWDKNKQNIWVTDRDRALDDIYVISTRYRIPQPKVNEITQAFGQAVAGGLIINDAKDKLVNALNNENSRKAMMIDTTQSVLELLK